MRTRTISSGLVVLALAMTAAAQPLSIGVRVVPESALPGVPVSLRLSVRNRSNRVQMVPSLMLIRVRHADGTTFFPSVSETPVRVFPEEYSDLRAVAPRTARVFEVPLAEDLTAGAMADPRLWAAGDYEVQLILHDLSSTLDAVAYQRGNQHPPRAAGDAPLVTPYAVLRVEVPRGVDADIWSKIVERTHGRGLMVTPEGDADAIARELWGGGERSFYLPYVVRYTRHNSGEESAAICAAILERYPRHPVADVVRLSALDVLSREAETMAFNGGDLSAALQKAEVARVELDKLRKVATSGLHRLRITRVLTAVPSAAKLKEIHREMREIRSRREH
jgi:hypothetical protein